MHKPTWEVATIEVWEETHQIQAATEAEALALADTGEFMQTGIRLSSTVTQCRLLESDRGGMEAAA